MRRAAPVAAAVLASLSLLIHATSAMENQPINLIRVLAENPWLALGAGSRGPYLRLPQGLQLNHNMPAFSDSEGTAEADDPKPDFDMTENSEKRSAVATALNAGRRRRRQPSPALGVLNDVGSFFDSLRDNLETLAALSPQQRATLMHEPAAVRARQPASGSPTRIGGGGMRRMFPARINGNIRSYNRRSFVEAEGYHGANNHDPAFLWTGLGR